MKQKKVLLWAEAESNVIVVTTTATIKTVDVFVDKIDRRGENSTIFLKSFFGGRDRKKSHETKISAKRTLLRGWACPLD
jgi:hypothetical protein